MIAPVKPRRQNRQTAAPKFEELLPRIKDQASYAFRDQHAGEREELVAECIANAYVAFDRLEERGKGDLAYAVPLAQYAIKQVRVGRRVGAKLNIRDISSDYCQLANRLTVDRLDEYDPLSGAWKEVVVEDRSAGPADIATMRVDFAAWLRKLPRQIRSIAKVLATGETTGATARRFNLSAARISQLRRELQDAWQTFQGDLVVV
jgi:hypothetical protein